MAEVRYLFSVDDAAKSFVRLSASAVAAHKAVVDAVESAQFAERVRPIGSGAAARIFGRLEAWKAARVERQAQAAFERGWL